MGARHLRALERNALDASRKDRELRRTLDDSADVAVDSHHVGEARLDL
jgi:hypothetical protein